MNTYTQIIYQIVFSTKHRVKCLTSNNRNKLFKYMSGIVKNKSCHLYQIGGVSVQIPVMLTTLFRFMLTSHFDV